MPRDVDASNDDVVEHGFHEDVNHTDVLRFRRRLGDVDDVVEFGFFVGDGFAVETGVFGVVLVVRTKFKARIQAERSFFSVLR